MTEYYVRADGEAVDKEAAIGPTSSAAACMSAATFNNETFEAGDTINFSGSGGTFTTVETLGSVSAAIHIPSSGNSDNSITYQGILDDLPLIDLSGAASGRGIQYKDIEYAIIKNFQLKGDGENGCVVGDGSSGTSGSGRTIKVLDISVLENTTGVTGGDGFDLNNTAQTDYYNISATKCKSSDGGSDQCISFHTSAKGRVFGGSFSDSNYCYVGTDSAECYITGVTVSGMTLKAFETGSGDNTCIVDNSVVNVDADGGLVGIGSGATNPDFEIKNSILNYSSGEIDYVAAGTVKIHDNTINLLEGNTQSHWAFGGELQVYKNIINITECTSYFLKAEATGGELLVYSNQFTGGETGSLIAFKKFGGLVEHNVFKNINSFTQGILIYDDNGGDISICHNTVFNETIGGEFLDCDYDGDEGTVVVLKNNIFVNVNTVLNVAAGGSVATDYNCYYGSEDAGGAGSITFDPLVTSSGKISKTSPCVDTGIWITDVNDDGSADQWGKYVHRLPNIGADQGAGAPSGGGMPTVSGGFGIC